MARRENIKKTLGLTEYPWSSDDEDNPQTTASEAVSTTRRQADTTNSNLPGPSDSVHSPRRRNRVRVERELYWSLLNNPPRPPPASEAAPGPSRPTSSSLGATESIDLTSPMTNLQRILAIRKLRNNHTSNSHCVHPALQRSASSPRISGQGSSTPAAWAEQASLRANRRLNTATARIKKALARASSQSFLLRPPGAAGSAGSARPLAASRSPTRSPPRLTPRSPAHSPPTDSAPSDDADDIPFSPPPAAADPTDNDAEDQHEDQVDVRSPALLYGGFARSARGPDAEDGSVAAGDAPDGRPASASAPRAADDGRAADSMDIDEDESPPADDVSNQAQASGDEDPTEETAEGAAAAASRTIVKRKRQASVQIEQFTVEDLNRSLLQLLECPVCLEWMDPPMSQCRRGHLVCVRCRARLSACPVCRAAFSSMRNRAMEGVAEKLRYPCRHGCGRETQLRQRGAHEASCPSRRYRCPAAVCAKRELLPLSDMSHHFQTSHAAILRVGSRHEFSMKMNVDQHDDWLLMAGRDLFYMRVDVNIRTWGVVVHVAYIGPKCKANTFTYEVSVLGLHKERRLVYRRETHSDLESASLNVSRQDCFHLTLDQALNFLRYRNRHAEPDKFLEFSVEIAKREPPARDARDARDDPDS